MTPVEIDLARMPLNAHPRYPASAPYGPLCGSVQCADRCMLSPGRFGCPALSPPHPMTEPDVSIRELTDAERAAFAYLREAHLSD